MKEICFTIAPSYSALQKIRTCVFNAYSVEIFGVTAGTKDTEFSYHVKTKHRLNKVQEKEIGSFIKGVIACHQSF